MMRKKKQGKREEGTKRIPSCRRPKGKEKKGEGHDPIIGEEAPEKNASLSRAPLAYPSREKKREREDLSTPPPS